MAVTKVDISSLARVHLEPYLKLTPREFQEKIPELTKVFDGTDLQFNAKTQNLEKGISQFSLEQEAKNLAYAVSMDENHDWFIDISETKKFLEKTKSGADPQQFLGSLEKLKKIRYEPLVANLDNLEVEQEFEFFAHVLKDYNEGIRFDDERQAQESLRSNMPHKSVGNFLAFLPTALYKLQHWITGWGPATSIFLMDTLAGRSAKKRFEERSKAIAELGKVFHDGLKKGEEWARLLDLPVALKKVADLTRKILVHELAAEKLLAIYSIADDLKRAKAVVEFSKQEFSTFLGYGGGNTSKANGWNWSGKHNNLTFAHGALHSILTKLKPIKNPKSPAEVNYNHEVEQVRREAKQLIHQLQADGLAGWNNVIAGVLQRVVTLNGAILFKPIAFRSWGEAQQIGAVGEGLFLGATLFGAYRGIQGVKDVAGLKILTRGYGGGIGGVWNAWKQGRGFAAVLNQWRSGGGRWWNLYLRGMGKADKLARAERAVIRKLLFKLEGRMGKFTPEEQNVFEKLLTKLEGKTKVLNADEITALNGVLRKAQGMQTLTPEELKFLNSLLHPPSHARRVAEAEAAMKKANWLGRILSRIAKRTVDPLKRWSLGKYETLAAGTKESLETGYHLSQRGSSAFVESILSLGITQAVAGGIEPEYDHYEMDYEFKPRAIMTKK